MLKNPLREKLKTQFPAFGMWGTLESPNVTEAAVAMELDWVLIETEHGPLGWKEVADQLRVLSGTSTAGLVRVPEFRRESIQRALDM